MDIGHTGEKPLYVQIYDQCRHDIMVGVYPAGKKLPPIRKLAEDLGVARNTVEAAYRQLAQEGYVTSRSGSGYVVERLNIDEIAFASELSMRFDMFDYSAKEALFDKPAGAASPRYDFGYGNLQAGTFPVEQWRALTTDALYGVDSDEANLYTDPLGDYELRVCIARHLAKHRGVRCFPEQIVVQPGTQAAVQNLLQLFDPSADVIAMEEPGYDGVRRVMENSRFTVAPCPVNASNDEYLDKVKMSGARLAFVTPSNQFPIGKVMSVQLRQRMLDWARTNDAYVIEDDYCQEFRYHTKAVPSLQSLDTYDRVVYIGTFSKALSPALRISYMVLPPDLLRRWKTVFEGYYSMVPWLSQAVLRRFMEGDHWDKLVRRVQTLNKKKHELLMGALKAYMGERVHILQSGAGLHVLVGVRDGRGQGELVKLAEQAGVRVYETDKYWIEEDHPMKNYVLVGFSSICPDDIEDGIKALAQAWFGQGVNN